MQRDFKGEQSHEKYKARRIEMYKVPTQIDEFMKQRCIDVACECGGELRQTRKGAFTAKCTNCGRKYKLGKRKR